MTVRIRKAVARAVSCFNETADIEAAYQVMKYLSKHDYEIACKALDEHVKSKQGE